MLTSKHAYYYGLKIVSRKIVAEDFIAKSKQENGIADWHGLLLGSIDEEALMHSRTEWPKHYSENTHNGFAESWEGLWRKFRPVPSFFDLAIWQLKGGKRVLQGLALGKPSDGKTHLTINWVERNFGPDYFKMGILLPILACAEEYAKLLKCERVLIKNAIDPSIYARYRYEEYRLRGVNSTYLCKELRDETVDPVITSR